jgi:prepilin-type N-terminal cleavage/methylation domain-containing protein
MNGTADRQAGFSLLEVMIVTVILIVVLTAVFQVISTGMNTYNTSSALTEIQGQARRVLDRVARELQPAGLATISPTPPATGTPGTHTITFQQNVGYSGSAITWGDVTTIAFAYMAGETNDGADNNNNGLVDEGVVRMTVTPTAGAPLVNDLGAWVKEDGLTFNLDGNLLTIRIEMQKYNLRNELLEATLETKVQIKN